MKNLRLFQTAAEYSAATLEYPSISLIKDTNKVVSTLEDPMFVDLGLPSGTKWMKYNIGATNETDYGLYFQFGDTIGYTGDEAKAHSTWATCPGNGGNSSYNTTSLTAWNNEHLTDGVLNTDVDAAYVHTLGQAKMPTQEQCQELINETNYEWAPINGINGGKFTSKSDSSKYIFIPAAGSYMYGSNQTIDTRGFVPSSYTNTSPIYYSYFLDFASNMNILNNSLRAIAKPVRGVNNC